MFSSPHNLWVIYHYDELESFLRTTTWKLLLIMQRFIEVINRPRRSFFSKHGYGLENLILSEYVYKWLIKRVEVNAMRLERMQSDFKSRVLSLDWSVGGRLFSIFSPLKNKLEPRIVHRGSAAKRRNHNTETPMSITIF